MEWKTVRIPASLLEEVEKFLESSEAKRLGINSVSHFITNAVVEYLTKFEKKPRLEYVNIYTNKVTILDRELEGRGRIIDVIFIERNHVERVVYPYCTYCQTTNCLHTDYVFEIGKVREILEKHGVKKRIRERGV